MNVLSRLWDFLTKAENRATLAWIGGGLVAAVTLYVTVFAPAPKSSSSASPTPTVSAPGGVAVGTISGGTVNVTPAPRP
jgi:hypothetical protein